MKDTTMRALIVQRTILSARRIMVPPLALLPASSAPGRPPGAAAESFSKIVLASPPVFPYSTSSHGGVAQLGERLTGSQEVRGSNPLISTIADGRLAQG